MVIMTETVGPSSPREDPRITNEAACERDAEGFLTLKGKVQFMDHFLKTHTHDFDESGFCMCGRLASLGSQVAQ